MPLGTKLRFSYGRLNFGCTLGGTLLLGDTSTKVLFEPSSWPSTLVLERNCAGLSEEIASASNWNQAPVTG